MEQVSVDMCGQNAACRAATVRAYSELRETGVVDKDAFYAAVRVFNYHHPKVRQNQACNIVADWIAPDA